MTRTSLRLRTLAAALLALAAVFTTAATAQAAPTIAVNDISITEIDSATNTATFAVTLSAPSPTNVTVNVMTANGTATTADYNPRTPTTITFTPGSVKRNVNVNVRGDLMREPNETVFLNLTSPTGATIADSRGVLTIVNNDPVPVLTVEDRVVPAEGAAGTTTPTTVRVKLSNPTFATVSFLASTAYGTAGTGDLNARTNVAHTIAPGKTARDFNINVRGDALDEINEVFTANISSVQFANVGDSKANVTITDDDPLAGISVSDVTIAEPVGDNVLATATVSLSAKSGKDVFVNFSTTGGTATGGLPPGTSTTDYYTRSNVQLKIPAGSLSRQANVWIRPDQLTEPAETFNILLSSPVNGTITDGTGVVTIPANCWDAAPNASTNALALPDISGDTGTPLFELDGSACNAADVDWYKFRLTESSDPSNPWYLTALIEMAVPDTGPDLDLFLYDAAGNLLDASEFAGGEDEWVYIDQEVDTAADDTRTYLIAVKPADGVAVPTDSPYHLSIYGN